MATFAVLALSLIFGFFLKASEKYGEPGDKSIHSTGKLGFFQRNKRRAVRVPCDLVVEWRDSTAHVTMGSGRVLDLSDSGACVATRTRFMLGERVQGRLRSINKQLIDISGHVVWIRPGNIGNYYGIQFNTSPQ